jgi:hypothetical protein
MLAAIPQQAITKMKLHTKSGQTLALLMLRSGAASLATLLLHAPLLLLHIYTYSCHQASGIP